MIVFFAKEVQDYQAKLQDEELKHCTRVLRHKIGDQINLVDGKGAHMMGIIKSISKKECLVKIESTDFKKPLAHTKSIGIAPTKNISRFEWFLEKATEIGVTDIYPIIFKQSERKTIKPERLQKIIRSAFKQSLRYYEPTLHPLQNFEVFIERQFNHKHKLIAHQDADAPLISDFKSENSFLILVGPEGDFRDQEIDVSLAAGFQKVRLGNNRLRTETAGLVALTHIA